MKSRQDLILYSAETDLMGSTLCTRWACLCVCVYICMKLNTGEILLI